MTEQPPTAKFNAAIASTERLHNLLQDCNFYSKGIGHEYYERYNNLMLWKNSIDAVFREIAAKLNEDEFNHIENMFKDLLKVKLFTYDPSSRHRIKTIHNELGFYDYAGILRKIEIQIRRLADKRGLLIPNKESVEGVISEME